MKEGGIDLKRACSCSIYLLHVQFPSCCTVRRTHHLVFLGFIAGLFDFIRELHLVVLGFLLELRYYFDQVADNSTVFTEFAALLAHPFLHPRNRSLTSEVLLWLSFGGVIFELGGRSGGFPGQSRRRQIRREDATKNYPESAEESTSTSLHPFVPFSNVSCSALPAAKKERAPMGCVLWAFRCCSRDRRQVSREVVVSESTKDCLHCQLQWPQLPSVFLHM